MAFFSSCFEPIKKLASNDLTSLIDCLNVRCFRGSMDCLIDCGGLDNAISGYFACRYETRSVGRQRIVGRGMDGLIDKYMDCLTV